MCASETVERSATTLPSASIVRPAMKSSALASFNNGELRASGASGSQERPGDAAASQPGEATRQALGHTASALSHASSCHWSAGIAFQRCWSSRHDAGEGVARSPSMVCMVHPTRGSARAETTSAGVPTRWVRRTSSSAPCSHRCKRVEPSFPRRQRSCGGCCGASPSPSMGTAWCGSTALR